MQSKKHTAVSDVGVLMELLKLQQTPISLGIYIRLKYIDKLEQLDLPKVHPWNYTTPEAYRVDAQALALVKKFPFSTKVFRPKLSPSDVCVEKWWDSENQCLLTNRKFLMRSFQSEKTESVLFTARNICARILGTYVRPRDYGFGPGATLSLRAKDSDLISKLRASPDVTSTLYSEFMSVLLDYFPQYACSSGVLHRDGSTVVRGLPPKVVNSEKYEEAPKNAETNRPLGIQPIGNMFIQKGLGNLIRSKLRSHGLDLNTREAEHSALACAGSIVDYISTIDLSSASDTISVEFVREILPPDWFDALDRARCKNIVFPFHTTSGHRLQKFSAMGNGFTFELESLLFFCIALAVKSLYGYGKEVVSIFGDDIIVSSHLAKPLVEVLLDVGFKTNLDKTYIDGPFKESCGSDYFSGFNVRPVYLHGENDEKCDTNIRLLNRISRIARFDVDNPQRLSEYRPIWTKVLERIPKDFRVFGPEECGDAVIHGPCTKVVRVGYLTYVNIVVPKYNYYCKTAKKHYDFRRKLPRVSSTRYTSRHDWSKDSLILACALFGVPSDGLVPRNSPYTLVKRQVPIEPMWLNRSFSWV